MDDWFDARLLQQALLSINDGVGISDATREDNPLIYVNPAFERMTGYSAEDFDWPRQQGFRVVPAEECWHRSLAPLMQEVREQLGAGPVYLSFDIDGLDPAFAPGTGTPEIGGLTVVQGLEIVRGCAGLELVGADLVEVAPAYDTSGNTSLVAANLLFEMLCALPGVEHR